METNDTVTIYVPLLEEGTATSRPTQAMPLGNGLYKLFPTPDYDPEDEIWKFLPGSIVYGKEGVYNKKTYLFAIKAIEP